jgi:hypothetical protein
MAPIVHTYRSGETGLFVNSYLVEASGVAAELTRETAAA